MYRFKSKIIACVLFLPVLLFCHGCGGEEDKTEIFKDRKLSLQMNYNTAAMIDQDGKLWTWGENISGQIGAGNQGINDDEDGSLFVSRAEPFSPAEDTIFTSVSISSSALIAIDDEGALWGCGSRSLLGFQGDSALSSQTSLIPLPYFEGTKFSSLCCSAGCLAIDTDGNLWGWTYSGEDAFVNQHALPKMPSIIEKSSRFSRVSMTNAAYFAIDEAGGLWSWGDCLYGELGNGTHSSIFNYGLETIKEPQRVCEGVLFQEVYATSYSTYAIDRDGHLWATGNNKDGQLGDGTKTDSLEFIRVKSNKKFVKVGGGQAETCFAFAIDEDGGLWFMGDRASISEWDEYQKLDEDQRKLTTPLRVMGGVRFVDISESGELALADNGDLYVLLSNWSTNNRLTHWVEEGTSVKRPLIIFP